MTAASSDAASIEAAALLLSKLGVTPEDLLRAGSVSRTPRPTFATYIPQLLAMEEINQVAGRTGNDPELDTLLLRLHGLRQQEPPM